MKLLVRVKFINQYNSRKSYFQLIKISVVLRSNGRYKQAMFGTGSRCSHCGLVTTIITMDDYYNAPPPKFRGCTLWNDIAKK
ncbi:MULTISPECIES: hypothetical protein [Okeania]|uniref:hypothetical protein n=1 Tax=Okeania TaxID=1458928 RepID=UPI000F535303|nr:MULTISPECIES: hypothetical protein [Okeania]NET79515.1 hypothetical protein [Okeania sp. SIO1F9]